MPAFGILLKPFGMLENTGRLQYWGGLSLLGEIKAFYLELLKAST
jgi:hypothetical protein